MRRSRRTRPASRSSPRRTSLTTASRTRPRRRLPGSRATAGCLRGSLRRERAVARPGSPCRDARADRDARSVAERVPHPRKDRRGPRRRTGALPPARLGPGHGWNQLDRRGADPRRRPGRRGGRPWPAALRRREHRPSRESLSLRLVARGTHAADGGRRYLISAIGRSSSGLRMCFDMRILSRSPSGVLQLM